MAQERFGASERFACTVLGQSRSALRKAKPSISAEEHPLRACLRSIASKYPAWGWPKARWHLLGQSRWQDATLNRKHVRRPWRDDGLTCKSKRRKKRRTGPGTGEEKRLSARYPLHVLSFDFQSDGTSCGDHIQFFLRLDEYTRKALAIVPPAPSLHPTSSRCWKASSPRPVSSRLTRSATTAPSSPPRH